MNKAQKEVQQSQLQGEAKTIRELKQVYGQAKKDCEAKIRALSMRTDMENLQSIVYQKQYQEVLKKQIDSTLDTLNTNQFTTVSEFLGQSYSNGYCGAMYDLKNQGIPMSVPIDQKNVVRALETDSKLSKSLYSNLGEDVDYLKKSIRAELSRGTSNGSSWNQIAVKIASGMNTPFDRAYNNAIRIARTEGHRIQQQSTMDALNVAKERGADVVKQWDATLDDCTREHHQELDGQIVEVDEPFETSDGLTAMFPGDFGDPAEDCNCRCCILQRAKWALDEAELDKLKERAKYFELDKTKDFEDFKEKYMKVSDDSGIIDFKSYKTLTPEEFKKITHTISKSERKIVYGKTHFSGYINSSNARKMNEAMRTNKILSSEYQQIADTLQNIIDKNVIADNINVTRFVTEDALKSMVGTGFPTRNLKTKAVDFWKELEDLPNQIKKGIKYTQKGFLSTSGVATENVMKDRKVMLNIGVNKGTHAYVTTNYKESEIIFGKDTQIEILGSRVENVGKSDWRVVLDCVMR